MKRGAVAMATHSVATGDGTSVRVTRLLRSTVAAIAVMIGTAAGCQAPPDLEVTYGQRRGQAAGSVNGTSILASLFEEAGFRVLTWRTLGPPLEPYDVMVWAPDDFAPPDRDVQDFVEQWLASGQRKTFVYIGRDYDAAVQYWEYTAPAAPAPQRAEFLRRGALAAAQHDRDRLEMPTEYVGPWFTMRREHPSRRANTLDGPWSAGIDAAVTDIRLRGLLDVPDTVAELDLVQDAEFAVPAVPHYEILLSDGTRPIVSRLTRPAWGPSQLIVIANGSFLLNLPLVNREHRKLAGSLIDTCLPGKKVAFLESGPAGPRVANLNLPTGQPAARRERVLLAAHWLVLGLVYCLSIFPIFGRPRSLPDSQEADFVQHIDALAELLERTRDIAFARRQVDSYHGATRREPQRTAEAPRTTRLRQRSSPNATHTPTRNTYP